MKSENYSKKKLSQLSYLLFDTLRLPAHQSSQLQIENGCNNRQVNPDLNVSEQRDIHDNYAEYDVHANPVKRRKGY